MSQHFTNTNAFFGGHGLNTGGLVTAPVVLKHKQRKWDNLFESREADSQLVSHHCFAGQLTSMKLLRCGPQGRERPALLDQTGHLRDLSAHIADVAGPALLKDSLGFIGLIDPDSLPLIEGSPRIGPCVGKIVGVGLNYADHAAESNMPVPADPPLFIKLSSAIVGPNDDVEIPIAPRRPTGKSNLGVIIGEPAKYVTRERAMDHVAGYCIVMTSPSARISWRGVVT